MNLVITALMGLVLGYLVGIALAAIAAFVFGFEDAARFIAIGCGVLGAATGPRLFGRLLQDAGR
jgi:hypothetical protein